MFAVPCEIRSEPRSAVCVTCGLDVPVATVTTLLAMDGVDFEEWDNADFTRPYSRSDAMLERPDHKERKFYEWGRTHGLTESTLSVLLSADINRITTLRNTPPEVLAELDLSKGQKCVLRSLMLEDWSCSFCGTYHTSPKNSCSVTHRPVVGGSVRTNRSKSSRDRMSAPPGRFGSFSGGKEPPNYGPSTAAARCNSLPDDGGLYYHYHPTSDPLGLQTGKIDHPGEPSAAPDSDEDPLEAVLARGRRNTTGQNFGYLHCHPKYWADIHPVPSKLIKML